MYCYTKLQMLQFYYDFLDKFVDREDLQLCEMDTDSLYFSLSRLTLEEVLKSGIFLTIVLNSHR